MATAAAAAAAKVSAIGRTTATVEEPIAAVVFTLV